MPQIIIENTTIDYKESELVDVERCDFAKIGSVVRTDEGYLQGSAPIAKVGVMTYVRADGSTFREFVPAETLFNEDSMATMRLKPITNKHPDEVLLDACSVKRRKVGSVGENIKRDGDHLVVSLVITDDDAVKAVEDGRQELSPGYRSRVLIQAGEYDGQKYDGIQISRKYNHLAICDSARGGKTLRLNLDSIELDKVDGFEVTGKKEKTMEIIVRGVKYDAPAEVVVFANEQSAKVDSLTNDLNAAKSEKEKLQGRLDSTEAKVVELQKIDNKEVINKGVKDRIDLILVAKEHLGEDAKIDEMSNLDIKKAVVKKVLPKLDLEGKTDERIEASFEAAVEFARGDAMADQRGKAGQPHVADKRLPESEKARLDSEAALKQKHLNLDKKYV
jgi:uncharacterized protein